MSMKLPSDHQARAAAIDPARSFLVQAPAGSGKTELLTDRILALLATVNRPEEIVAITFTRKAASEMHARVLSKLQAGLGPLPQEAFRVRSWELARAAMQRNQQLGWNLLEHPARLSIRTIDSFCTHLVRGMPWLSAMGGVPAIAEKAFDHYQAAARATLEMIDDEPDVAAFVQHLDVDLNVATELLADMLASRDQWMPLLREGGDVDALVANLNALVQDDLQTLAAQMPAGWASAVGPALVRAANVLAAKGPGSPLEPLACWTGSVPGTQAADVPVWQALAHAMLTGQDSLRQRVDIRLGFENKSDYKDAFVSWLGAFSSSDPWVSALARARKLPATGYSAGQQETVRVLLGVLLLAAGQLQLVFAQKGEVDFIEISQRAYQALGTDESPTDLLLALDASIRHILVDEFQDTSETQIALLARLTSGWMPGDGRTLFLVGDPMQSIYRFRKADVGGFLRVKAHGIGHIHLDSLELRDNFRSSADLVHWVNRTCGPVFPAQNQPDMGSIAYSPSEPFNQAGTSTGVSFHPVWVHKDQEDAASESSVGTGERVVTLAREALERHASSEHPVAILVRARSHLDDIVRRLTEANLPCRAVELVTLRSRQVVVDLVQLARALAHAGDRLAWLSVLRSPLCGITLTSLHALCGRDHARGMPDLLSEWLERDAAGQGGLPDDEAQRLRHAARCLLDSSNDSGRLPFAAWLGHQWQRLGGPAVYSAPTDRADAEQVFRLVEKLAPYGALDPVKLEEQLDTLYAAPSTSQTAIEVMTIHKSKGLEFETVILPGLHRNPMRDRVPLLMFERSRGRLVLGPIKSRAGTDDDPVSSYLAAREAQRASYEADRLLYVALTRARQQLHLVGQLVIDDSGQVKAPSPASLLGRLWPHMPQPEPDQPVRSMTNSSDARPDTRSTPPIAPLIRPDIASVPQAAPAPLVETAAGLPWQWRAGSDNDAIIGTVAHAWLERIGRDGLEAWSSERLNACADVMQRQLGRAGLTDDALDRGLDILLDTLCATLASERGRWLLGVARAHREWSLLDLDGRVSVIDLAISREDDWLVVDYKTGVPQPGETMQQFSVRMQNRYLEQLSRYCAHVSALDGRAARGALYFPRVDLWVEASASETNSC